MYRNLKPVTTLNHLTVSLNQQLRLGHSLDSIGVSFTMCCCALFMFVSEHKNLVSKFELLLKLVIRVSCYSNVLCEPSCQYILL